MSQMRTNLLVAALGTAGLLSASCVSIDCVKGTGDPVKKDLQVAAFHGINVMGALDVRLTRAEATQVTVEGQANLIDLVETTVNDGVWTITTSKCYSTDKPFVVHISLPVIDHVHVQGSGDVTGSGAFEMEKAVLSVQGSGDIKLHVNAEHLEASVQGSGDINLQGNAARFECGIQGSGDVKAADLKTEHTKANVTGSGDVSVSVSASLDASVTGSGNVRYRGNPPEVHSNVTGSGDVAPLK